jgi:hypothetical protein
MEVMPFVVPVDTLTQLESQSGESDLVMSISKVLDINLSEV